MTGWFNVTDPDYPFGTFYNNSDPKATTRIVYLNASYPQWTYSELALAEIDPEKDSNNKAASYNASSSSQLSIQMPSLRANMNCTVLPYLSAAVSQQDFLEVNINFPEACTQGGNVLPDWGYAKGILSTQWLYKPGIIGYWTPPKLVRRRPMYNYSGHFWRGRRPRQPERPDCPCMSPVR